MATEEWLEAARNYSRMPERARAKYWGLTLHQQNFLRGLPRKEAANPERSTERHRLHK